MVKAESWTYKPLAKRRQHASNMKIIAACLFGALVLTGIAGETDYEPETGVQQLETIGNSRPEVETTWSIGKLISKGHLFSRRQAATTSLPTYGPHHEALASLIMTSEDAIGENVAKQGLTTRTVVAGHLFSRRQAATTSLPSYGPHHEALASLIRTSEDAIGWIGNKTIDSIKNIKNLTASAVTPDSPLVVKKNKILSWLRDVTRNNGSASEAESPDSEVEDSGESVVIAHRTPDHGFSWGPPGGTAGDATRPGLLQRTLGYLYQRSKDVARRGHDLLRAGVNRVNSAKETLKTTLFKVNEKQEDSDSTTTSTTTTTTAAPDGPCEGEEDHVCAVDWARGVFTIFPSGCWARVYNQRHGTNFSIHDSDVCINLFARQPESYQKIENPGL